MPNQIVLAWQIDVAGSSFGPTQAAAALAAVPLYVDATTDPVLGQVFGLTVASDSTSTGATTATRTLTLNMTDGSGPPSAPPPFPCRPRTSTPPVLPYPLREAVTLAGSFFVTNGLMSVPTTDTQVPSLNIGDDVQFLKQEGVFYQVASVSPTAITITAPYTGVSGNTTAFKEVAAPVTIAAVYSSSELDTVAVATVPAIPAGAGARTVTLTYDDSAGGGPFTTIVSLTGKRPAAVALAGGSIDVAEIINLEVTTVGGFGNSVGEITLVSLSSALPALPPNLPLGTGVGAVEKIERTFKTMTDEAQLLIDRHLAYLPPSFFALSQQGTSAPALAGDFLVTTGSNSVRTTVDQSGVLSPGNILMFAAQPDARYTVATVTPKIVTLTTEFTGIDTSGAGTQNIGTNANAGTRGNLGDELQQAPSGAVLVDPSPAAPPSNDQLSATLGQFVAPEVAAPPPKPPLSPATVPVPTFLSSLFTQTLQLAIAGVPITPQPITFV